MDHYTIIASLDPERTRVGIHSLERTIISEKDRYKGRIQANDERMLPPSAASVSVARQPTFPHIQKIASEIDCKNAKVFSFRGDALHSPRTISGFPQPLHFYRLNIMLYWTSHRMRLTTSTRTCFATRRSVKEAHHQRAALCRPRNELLWLSLFACHTMTARVLHCSGHC